MKTKTDFTMTNSHLRAIVLLLLPVLSLACGAQAIPAAVITSHDVIFPSLAAAPIPSQSEMVVCVQKSLNVRKSAGGEHANIWLKDGDIVTMTGVDTITEDMAAWTPIRTVAGEGFVNRRYLCNTIDK